MQFITQCTLAIVQLWSTLFHALFIPFIHFSLLSVLEFCPISSMFSLFLVDFGFLHNCPRNPRSIFLGSCSSFSVLGSQEQEERSHMTIPFESK